MLTLLPVAEPVDAGLAEESAMIKRVQAGQIVWLCFEFVSGEKGQMTVGVFDTEPGAIDACNGSTAFGIGPLIMNRRAPTEETAWPGAYVPAMQETRDD